MAEGMVQCLPFDEGLGCGGIVYGFITTGETWQMLRYDRAFQITEETTVLFDSNG